MHRISRDTRRDAFLQGRDLAVVGVSSGRGFANEIVKVLADKGWRVQPVGRTATSVEGLAVTRSLDELPRPVDGVVACVPPAATLQVVDDCLRLGIRRLWIQQGAESDEAIARAEAGGLEVVHHACVLMYARATGVHGFHAALQNLFRKY
jgi:uncharacterized protein